MAHVNGKTKKSLVGGGRFGSRSFKESSTKSTKEMDSPNPPEDIPASRISEGRTMAHVNDKPKKGLFRGGRFGSSRSFKESSTKSTKEMDSPNPPEDTFASRISERRTMAHVNDKPKKGLFRGGRFGSSRSFKEPKTKSTKEVDSPSPPEALRDKTLPTVVSGMGVLHGEVPPANRFVQSEEMDPSVTSVPDDKILHVVEPAQSRSSSDVPSTSKVHARGSIPSGEDAASKPSTGNLSASVGEEVHDAGGASSVTPPLDVKVPEDGKRYFVVSGMNSLPGEVAANSTSAPTRPAHASKPPTGDLSACIAAKVDDVVVEAPRVQSLEVVDTGAPTPGVVSAPMEGPSVPDAGGHTSLPDGSGLSSASDATASDSGNASLHGVSKGLVVPCSPQDKSSVDVPSER